MIDYQRSIKSVLLLAPLVCMSFSCSDSSSSSVERLKVSGTVLYNGDPLSSAKILFISETPEGTIKSSGIVRQGIYQIPAAGGPAVGKARVEIVSRTPELEEITQIKAEIKSGKMLSNPLDLEIPDIYNKKSQLTALITKDGQNSFDFKIESK
ncbi:hypothetical protein [Gimesia sp.]|uniref:hypothetical protein n=1 Tax=Gimesia sp. TaxID=2024833 RepID=UPI000ECF4C7B|nr:hypothetical protein [Gimesia sp.]HAH43582.1 hypothetical protein [Planctomycetaceae bacterium]|tara:strand:+ start:410 stop:868 length:459 start_codon:yes stop_codon:yes gene_type:complete